LARRLWLDDHRAGSEVEGDAEDVGILRVEQPLIIQLVGLPAQGAAHHLLAEELRAEGAHAKDVGDVVGVPAFGEHRDRDHTADLLAELARLAHCVHHLAQQILIREAIGFLHVAGALDDRAAKALDLVGRNRSEALIQRLAGFELFTINEQGVGAGQRVAGGFVEVAKERQSAVDQRAGAVLVMLDEAGNVVIDLSLIHI
jgi:hypothetical protein